jgi:beta-lactamase regulating signal transducer with metallopeptidase domain
MTLALVIAAWLLTYLVHSTILLGGAWTLSATGVVKSPVVKDVLWKVCLVGALVTATVQARWPEQPFSRQIRLPDVAAVQLAPTGSVVAAARPSGSAVPRAAAARAAAPVPASVSGSAVAARHGVARAAVPTSASAGPTPHTLPPTPIPSWPLVLLALWIAGAASLLVRVVIRRRRFCRRLGDRRVLTEGPLVEMLESLSRSAGLRRRVQLSVSAELAGPVAMGVGEICLPERVLSSLAPAEQRAVLAHELGHLVRRDPAWLATSVAVESLFFFQPLNRLARRRIQDAAEYLCDDWAVKQTGGSLTLAKSLAEVASWMQVSRLPVPVSGMAENRSHLVVRVQRLLDGAEPRAVRGLRLAVPVAALALSTVAFAAPGVLPPCTGGDSQGGAAVGAAPAAASAGVVAPAAGQAEARVDAQGEPYTWATVRGGDRIAFRRGFAARITGQGRLGIRRGGRVIELLEDQRLLINGRPAADTGVALHEGDTVRIADAEGQVLWTLAPVRLTADQVRAQRRTEASDIAGLDDWKLDSLDASLAPLDAVLGDVDTLDTAALAAELGRVGARLGRDLSDELMPAVAQVAAIGAQISARVAPRAAALGAEMGARIAEQIGPIIAQAFGDSAWCDSTDSDTARRPRPKRR